MTDEPGTALRITDADGADLGAWGDDRHPLGQRPTALRLQAGAATSTRTDLLGLPRAGLSRRPPVPTELRFLVDLHAPDCPLGTLDVQLLVDGSGKVTAGSWSDTENGRVQPPPTVDHEPMAITAGYVMLVGWLHRAVIFGHLLWSGAGVSGDLLDFAALDGIVSAPPEVASDRAVTDEQNAVDLVVGAILTRVRASSHDPGEVPSQEQW